MGTRTSTHRGFSSTSLTAAPTETSAPVHEFRCLYTRDLHKKSKKWHDGSLKFHTFNRRVMAYDDDHGFIGDLHYRQEEDFGEGLEIRLDRGVLIEVGERLGETQTDLAQILDRQRPEKRPSARGQPVSLSSRPQASAQSQRPKSLLEVLGPSQGRLGRARILYQSPYEQLHTSARVEPAEPPQKRQRMSRDKENYPVEVRQPDKPTRPSLPQPMQPSKPVPQPSRREESPIEFEEVFDLSSEDRPRRQPIKPARLTVKPKHHHKETPDKRPLVSGIPYPKQPSLYQSKVSNVGTGKDKQLRRKSQSPNNTNKSTRTAATTYRLSALGTARLLLSLPKPRRKLTCTLPVSTSLFVGATSDCAYQPLPRQRSLAELPSPEKESRNLSVDGPTLPVGIPSPQPITHEQQEALPRNSSPLFVPEAGVIPGLPSPSPASFQDNFSFSDPEYSNVFESLDQERTSQQPLSFRRTPTTPDAQGEALERPGTTAEQSGRQRLADRRAGSEPESAHQNNEEPELLTEANTEIESEEPSRVETVAEVEGLGLAEPLNSPRSDRQIGPGQQTEPGWLKEKRNQIEAAGSNEPDRLIEPDRRIEAENVTGIRKQVEAERSCLPTLPSPTKTSPPLEPHFEGRLKDLSSVSKQPAHAVGRLPVSDGRPFRRALSGNDVVEHDAAPLTHSPTIPKARSPMQVLENLSTKRNSAKVKSPTKIQRCASDSLALETAPRSGVKAAEQNSKEPAGPWTVDEAFLLFDSWPAEIEKPAYWVDTPPQRIERAVPEPIRHDWGGITTARQFLRDDVNVL